MDSPEYTPRRGFWIATTLVIIVAVFPILFLGAFSGIEGGNATNLLIHFGLVMIPSSCVALLQALMLVSASLWARVRWFGFTLAGTAIGWGAVFALEPLLRRLQHSVVTSCPRRIRSNSPYGNNCGSGDWPNSRTHSAFVGRRMACR